MDKNNGTLNKYFVAQTLSAITALTQRGAVSRLHVSALSKDVQ